MYGAERLCLLRESRFPDACLINGVAVRAGLLVDGSEKLGPGPVLYPRRETRLPYYAAIQRFFTCKLTFTHRRQAFIRADT